MLIRFQASQISVQAEHTCGQVDLIHTPSLEVNAVRVLCRSPDPINDFRQVYGDFYVAGYRVGAVNRTTVSGDMANKSFFEAKKAEIEVKAFFIKTRRSINEVNASGSNDGGLNVSAFDSLSQSYSSFTAHTEADSLAVAQVATENKQKAMDIANRAASVLDLEFALGIAGGTLRQEDVNRMCDRGLVTEVLLAPFASLREYQALLSLRCHRG